MTRLNGHGKPEYELNIEQERITTSPTKPKGRDPKPPISRTRDEHQRGYHDSEMSNTADPREITGDPELDLALHAYLESDDYRAYDAVQTRAAKLILEQSDSHMAYNRVVERYVLPNDVPRHSSS